MGRKVFISSDMSIDERLAAVAESRPDLAILWPWFLTAFDDWGRAEAQPRRLKLKVFPMMDTITPDIVSEAITAFAACGLLQCYSVDGHEYMAIEPSKWFGYQTHIHRSKRDTDGSRYPAHPVDPDDKCAESRGVPRNLAESRGIGTQNVPSPSLSPSLSPLQRNDDDNTPVREALRLDFAPKQLRHLSDLWTQHMGGTLSPMHVERLSVYREANGPPLDLEVIGWAMEQCAVHEKRTLAYLDSILRNCQTRGHTTLVAVLAHENQRKEQQSHGRSAISRRPVGVTAGRHENTDSLDDLIQT
jgi:DnaD/phage-associated family protein